MGRRLLTHVLLTMVFMNWISTPVKAMSGPDPNKLTVSTFDISGRKLLLPLPSLRPTKDLDEVRRPLMATLEIEKLALSPTMLLDDMWDWKSFLHLYGSISIKVYAASTGGDSDVTCRENLVKILRSKLGFANRSNPSRSTAKVVLPIFQTDVREIVGRRAVSYRWRAYSHDKDVEDDEELFAVALSESSYLTIRINYYGGGDPAIAPSEWLTRADDVKRSILEGIRFNGEWPKVRECE